MTNVEFDSARDEVVVRAQQLVEAISAAGSLDAALSQLDEGISEFERSEDTSISVLLADDATVENVRWLGSGARALAHGLLCVDSQARRDVTEALDKGLPYVATAVLLLLVRDDVVLAGTISMAASITAIACARGLDDFCSEAGQ